MKKVVTYHDLKRGIASSRELKMVEYVPIVIGTLGCVTKELDRWIEKLGITCTVEMMQKTALLGTAAIMREVLEM